MDPVTRDTYRGCFEQGKGHRLFFSIAVSAWRFLSYYLLPFFKRYLRVTCHRTRACSVLAKKSQKSEASPLSSRRLPRRPVGLTRNWASSGEISALYPEKV